MGRILKTVSVLLTICCAFSAIGVFRGLPSGKATASSTSENYAYVKDSEDSYIEFNESEQSFSFESGEYAVSSLPPGNIKGLNRMTAISALVITVINENGEIKNKYSFSDAEYEVYRKEEKIRTVFRFDDPEVSVPLDFYVRGKNSFAVSVPADEIRDSGGKLLDIAFLPYLGAGNISEDGYILVPDGSGAGIRFGNGKSYAGNIRYSVFGSDYMNGKEYSELNAHNVNMPMYAFVYGEKDSLVAYADKGAALASLNVSAGNADCPYSTAYFTFNYRPYTLTTLLDRTSQAQKFYIASKSPVSCENFEVIYQYLNDEGPALKNIADYVSGRIYGDREKKEASKIKAYLDIYMSVYKRVYTFGIPHNGNVALTDIKDCGNIAADFGEPVLMLRGLDKYGASSGTVDSKFTVNRNIGGIEDYEKLSGKYKVYNACEFVKFDISFLGLSKLFDSARSVTGKTLTYYSYNPATLLKEQKEYNIAGPGTIVKTAESYIKSLPESCGAGIAPVSLSNSPYTDNKESDRQNTADIFAEALGRAKKSGIDILLYEPDAFALEFAEEIISLPVSSSGQTLIDFDIPFIQMVVRDYADYSGRAVNISGDMGKAVLECARAGADLCFAVTNSDYKIIRDTELDYLYSTDYNVSGERMVSVFEDYSERMAPCAGRSITDFAELSNGITVTEFSGNVKVYVNMTETEYITGSGAAVLANDYYVEVP